MSSSNRDYSKDGFKKEHESEYECLKTDKDVVEYDTWDSMDLKDEVLRGLYSSKFNYPSKIQAYSVIPMKEGFDIIAQAQSGSGKTPAFITGILERIDDTKPFIQAIILANTKELASQIKYNFDMMAEYMEAKSLLCIGGKPDVDELENDNIYNILKEGGIHVIIGTPGKIIKLIQKKKIKTSTIKTLVLDEADELLGINFIDQIKQIIMSLSQETQICIFSATYNKRVVAHTQSFMRKDMIKKIKVDKQEVSISDIKQYFIFTPEEHKIDCLLDLYGIFSIAQTIIYVNKKKNVEWLSSELIKHNYTCGVLHADIDAKERVDTMKEFRKGNIRVLIASDLIARGIDIEQVKVVINFDIPNRKETYIHRIGRTGRFGRKGIALNFVTKDDAEMMEYIEKNTKSIIEPFPENKDEFQKTMKDLIGL
jgi:superfamily II DNA/RNA helicase